MNKNDWFYKKLLMKCHAFNSMAIYEYNENFADNHLLPNKINNTFLFPPNFLSSFFPLSEEKVSRLIIKIKLLQFKNSNWGTSSLRNDWFIDSDLCIFKLCLSWIFFILFFVFYIFLSLFFINSQFFLKHLNYATLKYSFLERIFANHKRKVFILNLSSL